MLRFIEAWVFLAILSVAGGQEKALQRLQVRLNLLNGVSFPDSHATLVKPVRGDPVPES